MYLFFRVVAVWCAGMSVKWPKEEGRLWSMVSYVGWDALLCSRGIFRTFLLNNIGFGGVFHPCCVNYASSNHFCIFFGTTKGWNFCPYTAACSVGFPEWASSDEREIKYLVRVLKGWPLASCILKLGIHSSCRHRSLCIEEEGAVLAVNWHS